MRERRMNMSALRLMSATKLAEMRRNEVILITHCRRQRPVAAVVSYEQFMRMQDVFALMAALPSMKALSDSKERER